MTRVEKGRSVVTACRPEVAKRSKDLHVPRLLSAGPSLRSGRQIAVLAGLALLIPVTGFAQNAAARPDAFRHERPILPAAPGANRLSLDAAILAGGAPFRVQEIDPRDARVSADYDGHVFMATGGLSDLRLYEPGGREVPYLLVSPKLEASWRGGRLLRVAPTKETSGFEVDFETTLPVDRVRLEGLASPFLKRVRLEGSGDREHWTLLVAEGTLFDLPQDGLEQNVLEFAPGNFRYLRVTWDDRSSGRMRLPSAALARVASPVRSPSPLRVPLGLERRASEPGKSRYRLRLPGARLPVVALELQVGGGNVLRHARVTEARLEQDRVAPAELGEATLRRAVRGDIAAAELRVPIAAPHEAELELTVDDGDNPPLDLTGVTAVFATLPFIYFESSAGQPLTARYGNDRLAPPRYDLEAMRDRVPAMRLVEARWGEPRGRVVTEEAPLASVDAAVSGAPIDVKSFRYSRPIPTGTPGLAALRLDVAVLAHSDLSDLRIAAPDGHQVPYLLERLDEPLAVELPAPERVTQATADATRSRYRIPLPYETLPESRLVLRTGTRVFERRVSVEVAESPTDARVGDRGRGSQSGMRIVTEAMWRHDDPESATPALTLTLPPVRARELFIVVDEGDNGALPVASPTLLFPSSRLRFFRDGRATLSLLYGRGDLRAPRYDLALLAPRLLGAPAQEIVPGPEAGPGTNVTSITPTIVFWGALVVAILALLGLIARLLRPGPDAPTAPATEASAASPAPPISPVE